MKSASKRGNVRASSMRMARARVDTLWQADVEAEKNRITQAYARMESYQAFKEKGGELTDAQNQDYTALQAIYGGFESAEAAVSAMEKDENSSLGKLVASRENYGWTENDLLYSIADTIINSEGSSTTTARATTSGARTSRSTRRTRARWAKWVRPSPDVSRTRTRRSALRSSKPFLVPTSVTSRARTEWFPSRSRSPSSIDAVRGTSP